MKPRQTFILFGVVAVIVAAIAVYELGIKPRQEKKQSEQALFFPDLDPEQATEISILRGDSAVNLIRGKDKKWRVGSKDGYPADEDAVQRVLEILSEIKMTNLVSSTKQSHERLGVDDKGIRVKVKAGEDLKADLIVGKQGKNYGTYFVRKADAEKVYLVLENIKSAIDKKSSAWRDKSVFDCEPEEVKEVALTFVPGEEGEEKAKEPKAPLTLHIKREEKEGGEWTLLEGDTVTKLDKSKTDALVRNLCTLRASDFADDTTIKEAGLDKPSKKATFSLQDGKSYTLLVGKKEGARWYVKRADREVIQRVYQYNINNIFKEKSDLLPPPKEEKKEGKGIDELLPAPELEKKKTESKEKKK